MKRFLADAAISPLQAIFFKGVLGIARYFFGIYETATKEALLRKTWF